MIKIKLPNKVEATFSGTRWRCDDQDVQKMLNGTFDVDEVTVSDAYRTFHKALGLDAVALKAVWHLDPEVTENVPPEAVPEEEGVVY